MSDKFVKLNYKVFLNKVLRIKKGGDFHGKEESSKEEKTCKEKSSKEKKEISDRRR
ncbi:MAG: hypothetical protein K9L86_06155 [Candidatus Omnitrophica bacterium]|nr:hypothetical protein [Candidatus Omnitrophota bacterium]